MSDINVSLENLTKLFGKVTAVDHINLNVKRGEFLTLLGPSGCGKTTLLRMIAGFEEPTSGSVHIDGQNVTHVPPHKRPVNMVFQHYALFPHLSVFDNVAFGLRVKRVDEQTIKQRVDDMLEMVQLPGFGDRRVTQLSGGQAQRVALGRALVNEPEVLLLDEPLGALDLKIRQQMQLELKLLHAELGTTFIYVTHDQEEAMSISDVIVVMRSGKVIQKDTPVAIYTSPANAFVADFIGHSNILPAVVAQIDPTKCQVLGGEVWAHHQPGLDIGREVNILIRPEALTVHPREGSIDFDNVVQGQVVDATFKGAFVHYLVEVADTRLTAHQAGREGMRLFSPGEAVALGWNADDTLILPD